MTTMNTSRFNLPSSTWPKKSRCFCAEKRLGRLDLNDERQYTEYLEEERDLLLEEIKQSVAETRYKASIGVGASKNQIADIYQSFVEALVNMEYAAAKINLS